MQDYRQVASGSWAVFETATGKVIGIFPTKEEAVRELWNPDDEPPQCPHCDGAGCAGIWGGAGLCVANGPRWFEPSPELERW
jgi:hypothetical protein